MAQPGMYPPGYYPPGYYPPQQPMLYQGPPPNYNVGRAIMPNKAGGKARRIMSTLFNVGRELKAVERSADYVQGGIVRNHMDKNRAYMNSTDDIEIVAHQMDRLLNGKQAQDPSIPVDIDDVQSKFMSQATYQQMPQMPQMPQPVQYETPVAQPEYYYEEPEYKSEETNIMPVDVNQYIKPQQPAQSVVQKKPQPSVSLAVVEKALTEMNNKLEAIAQMIGMLVQGQKNSVEAIQQAMTVSLGDSIAKAVSGALNTFVEMQGEEPEFTTDFEPDAEAIEEAEVEQA